MEGVLGAVTGRAAVLGQPVSHSLSPVLHNAAYLALERPWRYEAIECGEQDLAELLATAGPEWMGFSVTMPLKRMALTLADEVTARADAVGAANTLLPLRDDEPHGRGVDETRPSALRAAATRWQATNTDVDGILGALGEVLVRPRTATILGAGGTAQAAVAAVAELGLSRCSVLVREPKRATDLTDTARRVGVELTVETLAESHPALESDLLISTLPAHAADRLGSRRWRDDQVIFDVVYDPWPTALADSARRDSATVISGALMLLHQAAAQVELMTGCVPPIHAMREALRAAAPHSGV
ncbi:shikimate dehydrogenase [Frankineae bacterium MT45]|nr:shikimate dehydrogenase [Frankineae bacterium MT45]